MKLLLFQSSTPRKHRKIIRDEDLLQSTKKATQEEQERRKRVAEREAEVCVYILFI